jgi:hypothetical protein
MRADYKRMCAPLSWVGIRVTVELEGVELGSGSLWGIERDPRTKDEVFEKEIEDQAQDVIENALHEARTKLAALVIQGQGVAA